MTDSGRSLTYADHIWNRACLPESEGLGAIGDRRLWSVIRVHSIAMNGGLDHAVDHCTHDQVRDAAAGFLYLGMDAVAELLTDVQALNDRDAWDESRAAEDDDRYNDLIPRDDVIIRAFEAKLASAPSDFVPLDPSTLPHFAPLDPAWLRRLTDRTDAAAKDIGPSERDPGP